MNQNLDHVFCEDLTIKSERFTKALKDFNFKKQKNSNMSDLLGHLNKMVSQWEDLELGFGKS